MIDDIEQVMEHGADSTSDLGSVLAPAFREIAKATLLKEKDRVELVDFDLHEMEREVSEYLLVAEDSGLMPGCGPNDFYIVHLGLAREQVERSVDNYIQSHPLNLV